MTVVVQTLKGKEKIMERRRSLLKDGNDIRQFRHHRDRHVGHAISNEYYQQAPYFFTRECAQLNLIGQYKGASAFLILNGPSLVSGEYDLSLLNSPGVITYGVNNGPATFRPNFWSCVDDPTRFLKSIWMDPRITKFVPHAHAEKPIFDNEKWEEMKSEGGQKVLAGECPNCVFFHRNEKFVANRWLFEDKINWGNSKHHGGGRSVMLPALRILFLLGFRRVYLIGADFKMTEEYAYHFDEKRHKGAVNNNMNTYRRMNNEYFPQLKPYFKEEGYEVFNCTKGSGLTAFDYFPYEEAIAECTEKLGDVFHERTWGMYCKPGEKSQTSKEPSKYEKAHMNSLSKREAVMKSSRRAISNKKSCDEEGGVNEVLESEKIEEVEESANFKKSDIKRRPYKVVSVDNYPEKNQEVSVSSVLQKVEKIEEIAVDKKNIVNSKDGNKLIKRLPIRR